MRKVLLPVAACLLFAVAGSSWFLTEFVRPDGYTAEIRLLYLPLSSGSKSESTLSLAKEIDHLRSGEILFRVAEEICNHRPGKGPNAYTCSTNSGSLKRFRTPNEMARWLSEHLAAQTESSDDIAKVTLRLAGDDPGLLTEILEVYFRKYEEYRETLEEERSPKVQPVTQVLIEPRETTSLNVISEQLQKVELEARNCELSLQLMDSQKGSFGGFVPEGGIGGASSLLRFQEKIVELEIKKRAMAVQYTPNSRELRIIDQEIAGVRTAMRECLVEYLRFLNRGKEALAAQKTQIERKKTLSKTDGPHVQPGRCSGELPGGDAWFLLGDGLYVFRDKPSVKAKHWATTARERKEVIFAGLFPSIQTAAALCGLKIESQSPTLTHASWDQGSSEACTIPARPVQSASRPTEINFERVCRSAVPAETVELRISSGDAAVPNAVPSAPVRSGHGR